MMVVGLGLLVSLLAGPAIGRYLKRCQPLDEAQVGGYLYPDAMQVELVVRDDFGRPR